MWVARFTSANIVGRWDCKDSANVRSARNVRKARRKAKVGEGRKAREAGKRDRQEREPGRLRTYLNMEAITRHPAATDGKAYDSALVAREEVLASSFEVREVLHTLFGDLLLS
jgi:hypothetical protein